VHVLLTELIEVFKSADGVASCGDVNRNSHRGLLKGRAFVFFVRQVSVMRAEQDWMLFTIVMNVAIFKKMGETRIFLIFCKSRPLHRCERGCFSLCHYLQARNRREQIYPGPWL